MVRSVLSAATMPAAMASTSYATEELLFIHSESADPWSTVAICPHTGSTLWSYKGSELQGEAAGACAVQGDWLYLACAKKPLLHTLNVHARRSVHAKSVVGGVVSCVAVHPSGSLLSAAVHDSIHTWQTSSGALLSVVRAHYQPLSCLRYTGDGQALVSAGLDGALHVHPLCTLLPATQNWSDAAAGPGRLSITNAHSLGITDMQLLGTADDLRVLSASADCSVKLHACRTPVVCLLSVSFDAQPTAVVMDAAEARLCTGFASGTILVFNLSAQRAIRERHLVTQGDGTQDAALLKAHTAAVTALTFSLDCSLLCSGDADGTVHIWHVASRQSLRKVAMKGRVRVLQALLPTDAWLSASAAPPPVQTPMAPLQRQPVAANLAFQSNIKPMPARCLLSRVDSAWADCITEQSGPPPTLVRPDHPPATLGDTADTDGQQQLQAVTAANKQLYEFCVKRLLRPE